MSIYKELLQSVDDGKKFKVDLINKSLWIGNKRIIYEWVPCNTKEARSFIEPDDLYFMRANAPLNEDPWLWIEFLYDAYKHSFPSENSNPKSYFKALSADELTDEELAYNIDRNYAQALLEGYILLANLQGWLKWESDNYWFWQSEKDKDLVVIKDWV